MRTKIVIPNLFTPICLQGSKVLQRTWLKWILEAHKAILKQWTCWSPQLTLRSAWWPKNVLQVCAQCLIVSCSISLKRLMTRFMIVIPNIDTTFSNLTTIQWASMLSSESRCLIIWNSHSLRDNKSIHRMKLWMLETLCFMGSMSFTNLMSNRCQGIMRKIKESSDWHLLYRTLKIRIGASCTS